MDALKGFLEGMDTPGKDKLRAERHQQKERKKQRSDAQKKFGSAKYEESEGIRRSAGLSSIA